MNSHMIQSFMLQWAWGSAVLVFETGITYYSFVILGPSCYLSEPLHYRMKVIIVPALLGCCDTFGTMYDKE